MLAMDCREFVRRVKEIMVNHSDSRFAFFLGAGCSVSSGIPAAGDLTQRWLPRLKKMKTGTEENLDAWVKKEFPGYHPEYAALSYGEVIEKLFLSPEERQKEIEKLIEGKDPGFGYAVLAQLMSSEKYGSNCNIVITTNFDDLVADALYLYTNKKPLVMYHESLANFVRLSRIRPLVIKLHGDVRLALKNTELETKDLDGAVKKVLKKLFGEIGLIFIGYGGNDRSIVNIFNELPHEALPWGIYWVGSRVPDNDMGKWLRERGAKWVKHGDFDELMLLIWCEFGLAHPDDKRFEKLVDTYFDTFKRLKDKIEAKPDNDERRNFEEAVKKAAYELMCWRNADFAGICAPVAEPQEGWSGAYTFPAGVP